MRFRVGLLDLCATIVVLVVILLPERSMTVGHAYEPDPDRVRAIALEQARLAIEPGNDEAADRLAGLLTDVGQTDWAVQVASTAAKSGERVSWRALLAVSTAHAERIEVTEAHRFAMLALDACLASGPESCPADDRERLSLYFSQLDAGVKSGIDPRIDPVAFQRAVLAAMRIVRFRGSSVEEGSEPAPPQEKPTSGPSGAKDPEQPSGSSSVGPGQAPQ